MANCTKCGKDVGCGCNLTDGLCVFCYAATFPVTESKPMKYVEPTSTSPIDIIINDTSLTQEEKLKRINDILEQANKQ